MYDEEKLSNNIRNILKAKTQSGSMTTTPTKLTPSQLLTGLPSNVTPQANREEQERMKAQEDLRANLTDKLKGITSRMKSKQLEIDNEQRGKNNPLKLNRLNQEMAQLRSEAGEIRQKVIADSGIKERQTERLAQQKTRQPILSTNVAPLPESKNVPLPTQNVPLPQQQPNKQQTSRVPLPSQNVRLPPIPPKGKEVKLSPQGNPLFDKQGNPIFVDIKNAPQLSTTPQMTPQKTIRTRKVKKPQTPKMSQGVKEILQRGRERGGLALRNPNEPKRTRIQRRNPNEPTTQRVQRRPVTVNPKA